MKVYVLSCEAGIIGETLEGVFSSVKNAYDYLVNAQGIKNVPNLREWERDRHEFVDECFVWSYRGVYATYLITEEIVDWGLTNGD